eukprot:GHVQ01033462.1.p1 GENE.GHVQ01033462.1~~GHVQ01033462.1.p1  ORF type:complete len:203 (+),score=19.20 GHVQ01033462.1:152-760(+)
MAAPSSMQYGSEIPTGYVTHDANGYPSYNIPQNFSPSDQQRMTDYFQASQGQAAGNCMPSAHTAGVAGYGYDPRAGTDGGVTQSMPPLPMAAGSFITPMGGAAPGTQGENGMLSFYDTNIYGDGGSGMPEGFMAGFDPSTGRWSANAQSNGSWTQAGWGGWDGGDGVVRKVIRKKMAAPEPPPMPETKKASGAVHKKRVFCC